MQVWDDQKHCKTIKLVSYNKHRNLVTVETVKYSDVTKRQVCEIRFEVQVVENVVHPRVCLSDKESQPCS
jgi:hypothetical protein